MTAYFFLEHIIATRIEHLMTTTSNQFGFKKSHSTLMPILILKDLLSFYHDRGSTMYVAFLDASKAFDRVNYATLFKLFARDVPGVILRLLVCWYAGQSYSILWAGVISSVFFITNGVRQSGVLSPLLFNL